MHRNSWVCPRCSGLFESTEALGQHIDECHSQEISNNQITTVIEQSRRPIEFIQPSECPFCDDEWASAEPSAISTEETLVVDLDEFRRHLGHHLQQVALFSLPRLNQDQEMDSNDVVGLPDRDTMSAGYRWVRDDCGRGWSIVSSRRTTFIALAFFLAKYRTGSTTHVDDKHGKTDNKAPGTPQERTVPLITIDFSSDPPVSFESPPASSQGYGLEVPETSRSSTSINPLRARH